MKNRRLLSMVLVIAAAVVLSGCAGNPDRLFRKGKYAEAYPRFVKRAGASEVRLKEERTGVTFDSRNKAGNQSIHDFSHAAKCLRKMGRDDEARLFYQRVVELSNYQIKVPDNRLEALSNAYDKFVRAARDFRRAEENYVSDSDPNHGWNSYRNRHNFLLDRRREFEKLLHSATRAQIPGIDDLKRGYSLTSGSLDAYLMIAAPGGLLRRPNSTASRVVFAGFELASSGFGRTLHSTQGNVIFETTPLRVSPANLAFVNQAKGAVGAGGGTNRRVDPSSAGTSTGVVSPGNASHENIIHAEQAMREAYQKYQSLITSGAPTDQIMQVLTEYTEAKAQFKALTR